MSQIVFESSDDAFDGMPGLGRRVLLVDDNPVQRKLVLAQLSAAGFDVRAVASGEDALAAMAMFQPSVIVSDVVMPEMDGFELCKRLRELDALYDVPIVLVSSHLGGRAERELAAAAGASALIERTPNFQAELEAMLRVLAEGAPWSGARPAPGVSSDEARGIAHDFANVLSVINASCFFLSEELKDQERGHEDVVAIQAAAERAISLTHRLRALGRPALQALTVRPEMRGGADG